MSSVELLAAAEQHAAAEGRVLSFDLFGPDSPGIVSSMMEAFNEGGVSVRSIQSELFDEAQPHFKMSVRKQSFCAVRRQSQRCSQ